MSQQTLEAISHLAQKQFLKAERFKLCRILVNLNSILFDF